MSINSNHSITIDFSSGVNVLDMPGSLILRDTDVNNKDFIGLFFNKSEQIDALIEHLNAIKENTFISGSV